MKHHPVLGQPARLAVAVVGVALIAPMLQSCGGSADLVIYSGRQEELVDPIIEAFEEDEGIDVEVRYGGTPELAAQLLEEGDDTEADVFFSQDAGALGALSDADLFADLDSGSLERVPATYASADGDWVGTTGRVRVIAFDPGQVDEADLPDDVLELASPEWAGRVGIAPENASFQSFVTAIRVTEGEDAARQVLEDLVANDAPIYENNLTILDAIEAGELEVGLVNHYYLHEMIAEEGAENVTTELKFLPPGNVGALVNVAGVGVIDDDNEHAQAFVDYLLSDEVQAEFVEATGEYALIDGIEPPDGLPTLEELGGGAQLDLGELHSLEETQDLLAEVGLI